MHKYYIILPLLAAAFMGGKCYSTEVLEGERENFHSFHSTSIAVIEPGSIPKDAKNIIIKLGDFKIESLEDDLNTLLNTSYSLDLSYNDLTHQNLIKIAQNPFIKGLDLAQTYLDNGGLKILSSMDLQFLDISSNRFDDEGMAYIASLNSLRELNIGSNKVTSAGIQILIRLNNLKILRSRCTYLEDNGIQVLSECKGLEELDVEACGLTDLSLEHLLTLPSLNFLNISNNRKITSEGIHRFLSKKRDSLIVKYNQ